MLELAGRQGGRITRHELRACGLTDHAIEHRVATGWLVREHPRVYRVAPADPTLGAHWAAILWADGDAHLSHDSAAAIHVPSFNAKPLIHVTVTSHNPGRTAGVRVHRSTTLPASARAIHAGLPVTSPLRTIVDCAATLPESRYEWLLGEFQIAGLVTDRSLRRACATSRPGIGTLRSILDDTHGFTRNKAERLLQSVLHEAGLPRPVLNAEVAGQSIDAFWPEQKLALEFHGYGPHRTRKKFENDALKSAALAAAGLRLMHATWRRLKRHPLALVADVATALAR